MRELVVSNSTLRTIQTCSTKAWLNTNGFGIQSEPGPPLKAGSDAHRCFEAYSRGARPEEAISAFLASYQPYSERLLLATDKYYHENLARILDVYCSANPLPTLMYDMVATEEILKLDLGVFDGVRYVVSDRSDGRAMMKDGSGLYAVEYKTTAKWLGPQLIDDYRLDSQITTHVAAPRANGLPVVGVILVILQWNKLPDPNRVTNAGKPYKCKVDGHGSQRDCWPLHVRYERFVLNRSDDELEMWRVNAIKSIHKYRDLLESPLEMVAQEGVFGACGRCDFLDFCAGGRRNLDSLFVREREKGVLYSGFYDDETNTIEGKEEIDVVCED